MTDTLLDRTRPPEPGELRPFEFPAIERFELANGLPVLFCRTDRLPVVSFSLLLPAGGVREKPDSAGLATLTAALLESGTRSLGPEQVAERLESMGVRFHAGASWEVSHVDFTALANRVGEAASLTAALVREPAFPEAEVERIRNEQRAGILQRQADPRRLANEMASRFIFSAESPFSRPLSGTVATVSSLGREGVRDFHGATFTPRGAGLIVAGNLTPEEAEHTAARAFGDWKGADALPAAPSAAPRSDGVQVVVVSRPGAVQSEIRVGHTSVPRNTPDYFPLVVMNTILGGAFSSRLNLNLREKNGFTYGASSSFAMRRSAGTFNVATAVQTEVTGAAVREILLEIDRMREAPPTDAELRDARQYVAGTFPLRLQTTGGLASALAEMFIYDLPHGYLEDFSSYVLSVDGEQVHTAARERLNPKRLTILVVGDPEKVRRQLEEAGFEEVLTVTAEGGE